LNILFIGPYFSKVRGSVSVAEKLAIKFSTHHQFRILLCSNRINIIWRTIDVIFLILYRKYAHAYIDTYSGNNFYITRVASFILRIRNKPYTLVIRGGRFKNFYLENPLLIKSILLNANSIISPSKFISYFLNEQGFEVEYLPNFIDFENFRINKLERKPHSILWVRAFSEIYNPLIPIEIVARLKSRFPNISLTMIGPDLGLNIVAHKRIKELMLENHVTILGSIPNNKLSVYYNSHSVFLNTTSFESFGMSLLEAACCGLPIVSSDVGEIPYLYNDKENIFLVQDLNIDQFVSNVEELFIKTELRDSFSKKGLELVQQFNFTNIKSLWEAQFGKFGSFQEIQKKKHGVLFVGTFLSENKGTKGPSELVSTGLKKEGFNAAIVSKQILKVNRVIEIVVRILTTRKKSLHIDVFSGANFNIARYASYLGILLGKKVFLNLHGGYLPEYYKNNERILKRVFYRADTILTPSKNLQEFFVTKGFQVKYLPNNILDKHFPYKETGVGYKILWIRAFSEIYQPLIALDVLIEVQKIHPYATLTMIGPDLGLLSDFLAKVHDLGLNDSVFVLGPIKNYSIFNFHHTHSVFINTTIYESFGSAVLEAASSGLPIVSFGVGEIPRLWTHKENIMIDYTNTAKGMAELVLVLMSQPEIRLKLIKSAKSLAEMFTWERNKVNWIDLLINK
jgi:glycosyltransferase involved in cell wall biosynthesis